MEIIVLIATGALVGAAVGLTGVGGGSLMTPLLLLFGYPAPVAIGTDLIYAGITKAGGSLVHHGKGNVRWDIVVLLALGSLPASLVLNLFVMDAEFRSNEHYEHLLTTILGFMLLMTALVLVFQTRIQQRLMNGLQDLPSFYKRQRRLLTWLAGVILGVCVTLSSVGAGAFGAAILFMMYPRTRAVQIVGSDIAHAVPLTLVAGLGYLYYGLVDFKLLLTLLIGSLPGIYVGSRLAAKIPNVWLRCILVAALLGLGINFIFFGH